MAMRAFLHDIHKDTWFKLEASQTSSTVTARGTRPGSPLADIGFNLLMSRIVGVVAATPEPKSEAWCANGHGHECANNPQLGNLCSWHQS